MQVKRGFTLIEILVVVLIIGITMGFALLAFGDFGGSRRVTVAAEQFVSYVKLAQQQAIMETGTLGIKLNKNNYQVLRFQAPATWIAIMPNNIFHDQHFPDSAITKLVSDTKNTGKPQIIINSTGDMTPFTLQIGTTNKEKLLTIVGTYNGNVSIRPVELP